MNKNRNIINSILNKILKELSDFKIDTTKNIKFHNNKSIDSLALVTFFSEIDKKFKPKKKLLYNYEKIKDSDQLLKYLNQK